MLRRSSTRAGTPAPRRWSPTADGNARVHYGLSAWAAVPGSRAGRCGCCWSSGFTDLRVSRRPLVGARRQLAVAPGRVGDRLPPGRDDPGAGRGTRPPGRRLDRLDRADGSTQAAAAVVRCTRCWRPPRLRLRTWRTDEIARITTARTNQATAHFLPFVPQPFTAEDARFWLKDMAEQAAAGRRFNWCVADAETDLGLGNLTLFGDPPRRGAGRRARLLGRTPTRRAAA